MKNVLMVLSLFGALVAASAAWSQDIGKLVEAVDQDKAADSVDMDKVKEAISE